MTPQVFRVGATAVLLVALGIGAAAAENERHGLSAFGELKYPAGFKHFEWVTPDAPKGGRLSMIGPAARTTFDSFNGFILKGDAAQGLDLPLDVRGTAFQQRVWQALRDIPAGATASYMDIAQRLSVPNAVRAVARLP